MEREAPRLAIFAGVSVAIIGLVLALISDGPYLTLDHVDLGVVLFTVGLFAALFAMPFALERGLRPSEPDRDRRWERALIRWGLVAVGVVGLGVVLAVGFGLDGGDLGGALALAVLADGLLIAGTLLAWMVSN